MGNEKGQWEVMESNARKIIINGTQSDQVLPVEMEWIRDYVWTMECERKDFVLVFASDEDTKIQQIQ